VVTAAGPFQNAAGTAPLAMIDVLFPAFWIILIAFAALSGLTFLHPRPPPWLHLLLLSQLAVMLYVTPFLLSGFSWSPDSLWHAGVAEYVPAVLTGADIVLTQYAQTYPFSFMTTYLVTFLVGDVFAYTLYVYPVVCTLAITGLAYVFAVRLFPPRVAFLALLLTLPALHYIEPHVSPFSAGTVLVLVSLLLLTVERRVAVALSFLGVLVLTVTHPISPISLGVFVVAAIFVSFLFRRAFGASLTVSKTSLLPLFLFLIVAWFSWTTLYAMPNYLGVEIAVSNIFNLGFLTRLFYASEFTVGGQAFIYPQIHQLSLAIYAVTLALVSLPLLADFLRLVLRRRQMTGDLLTYKRMTLSLAALAYAAMGFLLFISSGERFLLGRGLLFFLFMGALVIATYLGRPEPRGRTARTAVAWGIIVVLLCTFPIVSYSKEAYNTFTPSADAGLEFLAAQVPLAERSLSMGTRQQLAAYAPLSDGLTLLPFPPNLTAQTPDVVVLRVNAYWVIAMRYDLSFKNNSYNTLRDTLRATPLYDQVYSNERFDVYVRAP
jgi:hypothetical protein